MKDIIDFAFLDSGTGGIPYMLTLKEKQPDARCVYLGDTANFPYGEKSSGEIISCVKSVVSRIIAMWNPRAIVIACNTMSVTALEALRTEFPGTPIVGTVPAIKLATKVTRNKRIGLLATNATVNHPYNRKLAEDFASDCQVFCRGDPELIAFIEHDLFTATSEEKFAAVKGAVDFFAEKGCDTIILGCTHFTHIAEVIAQAAGKNVNVIDSREGVSNQALKVERKALEVFDPSTVGQMNLPADETFFVTECSTSQDELEYEALCRRFDIPWGGVIDR